MLMFNTILELYDNIFRHLYVNTEHVWIEIVCSGWGEIAVLDIWTSHSFTTCTILHMAQYYLNKRNIPQDDKVSCHTLSALNDSSIMSIMGRFPHLFCIVGHSSNVEIA